MALYVVTGGAGFIGSNIVQRLVLDGQEVRVVDDFSSGRRDNLAGALAGVAAWEGSVCDRDLLREAFDGADYVLHQAAVASVQASIDDPIRTDEVNAGGTLNLLLAARDCGVKRVVYASSCSVYGDPPELPARDDMLPAPASPYAVSKLSGEHYCRVFNAAFGLETVCLRYFNVYGPRQDPHSQYAAAVPAFICALMEEERPRVFGDGEQSRDFVYVDDVVEANLRAARARGAAGAVLNVGSGEKHSVNELLWLLAKLMGRAVEPEHCDARPGEVRHSQADVSAARRLIGYKPQVSFEEGLRRTVEWYEGKEATTFFVAGPGE